MMPATKADLEKKKTANKKAQIELDKRKLTILLDGSVRYIADDNKGAIIGKSEGTLRSRLRNIGDCTLDELAVFLSHGIVSRETVLTAVVDYIAAKSTESND